MAAPTPGFFKKIRNTGILVAAAGTALLSSPVVLPLALGKIAGYLAIAGTVAIAVSQATTARKTPAKKKAGGK